MANVYTSLQERMILSSSQEDSNRFSQESDTTIRMCCIWCGFKVKGNCQGHGKEFIGYGRIDLYHPITGKYKKPSTHKVAYAINSLIKEGIIFNSADREHMILLLALLEAYKFLYYRENLTLDHLCVDPRCWNPHHLRWTTIQQNLSLRGGYISKAKSPLLPKPAKKKSQIIKTPQLTNGSQKLVNYLVQVARAESKTWE